MFILTLIMALGFQLPPCPTEDSSGCYRDARQHGNGVGISFASFDGRTVWLP